MLPGKVRAVGHEHPRAEVYTQLMATRFNLTTAEDPVGFLRETQRWGSLDAYRAWLASYQSNAGNFVDHVVWGADRVLGDGHYLYGAMDDRYATNAARVFAPKGLRPEHVEGKRVCVIGSWDGTECLLLRAMGASEVDAVDEVPTFCEMAALQYAAWRIPGQIRTASLYELDVEELWQAYDLLYVPGVLYHLTDLPTALVMLWSMLKPGGMLAVESLTDVGARGATTPPVARYLGANVPGWNWWVPTPACYEEMLRDCGFPDARTVEAANGRGWWVGQRDAHCRAYANGAAGFSRPDVLRTIARLARRPS